MNMSDTPKLMCTRNYDMFELHPYNRDLREKPVLLQSMRDHGFMPSSPIQVVKNGNGKVKIVRGHHRYDYAKRLGLPIYYIIDDSNSDLFDLEADPSSAWNAMDFATAHAHGGNKNALYLVSFCKKYGLPIGIGAALVAGFTQSQGSPTKLIKTGKYIARGVAFATQVAEVMTRCHELGVTFAKTSPFISALAAVMLVDEFDVVRFLDKVKAHGYLMERRSRVHDYLDVIEAVYNHGARSKDRAPVKFQAEEVLRARNPKTRSK